MHDDANNRGSPPPRPNPLDPPRAGEPGSEWHLHPHLGDPVESISGYYVLEREETVWYGDRQVLYATGFAELDSSCCGYTGGPYAMVAGLLAGNHQRIGQRGERYSALWRVRSPEVQEAIRRLVRERTGIEEISFR